MARITPGSSPFDVRACFFERDPQLALGRRTFAECIGTLLLMMAATGAGAMAARGSLPPAAGLAFAAMATSASLVGLIVALGPISGGHFNPLITLLQWLSGERPLGCTLAYIVGQSLGAWLGALLANTLFAMPLTPAGSPPALFSVVASEVVASAGLMVIVFGCSRGGAAVTGPFAVGAWLSAAIVATPSTSYANPAITLASLVARGGIALPARLVGYYIPAEIAGALIALACIWITYGRSSRVPDGSKTS